MDLAAIIANGVATADEMTKSIQVPIVIHRWVGNTGGGDPLPADTVKVKAIVEKRQQLVRRKDGTEGMSRTYIAILEQILPVTPSVKDRDEPVDERDTIVLPDNTTGPVLATTGLLRPTTNRPYFMEVWLG